MLHFYLLWNKINGLSQHVSQLYWSKSSVWPGHYWRRYETIYTCTLLRFVKCMCLLNGFQKSLLDFSTQQFEIKFSRVHIGLDPCFVLWSVWVIQYIIQPAVSLFNDVRNRSLSYGANIVVKYVDSVKTPNSTCFIVKFWPAKGHKNYFIK